MEESNYTTELYNMKNINPHTNTQVVVAKKPFYICFLCNYGRSLKEINDRGGNDRLSSIAAVHILLL